MDIYERIKISDLSNSDVVKEIFNDINVLDNEDNKEDLISAVFKSAYEEFFNKCMVTLPEMDEIINSIGNLKEFFVNCSGLSSEEVDRYFELNNISIEKIVNSMLDKVNIEIEELELELKDVIEKAAEAGMSPIEYLEKEIKELEEQKSRETKENNEKIAAIMVAINQHSQVGEVSNDEINNLIAEYEEQLQEIYHQGVNGSLEEAKNNIVEEINKLNKELARRENSLDLPVVELDARIEKLENKILESNNKLNNMLETQSNSYEHTNEIGELENEIVNLQIDLNELKKIKNIKVLEEEIKKIKIGLGNDFEKFVVLDDADIEKNIENREKLLLEYKFQLNNLLNNKTGSRVIINMIGDLENEINDIEIDLNNLKKIKQIRDLENQLVELKVDFISMLSNEEIIEKISEYEEQLQEMYHHGVDGSLDESKKILIEKIDKLKQELEKRKSAPSNEFSGLTIEELKEKLKELEEKNKGIQSTIDKQVTDLKNKIEKLKRLEKLKKFSENKIIIDRDGPQSVPMTPEEEKIDKKEKRNDILFKCLSVISGFGLGLGLSAVPGVGTVRMVVSATKLASSGINFWTKKFPEGKVAKIVNAVDKKINNNKIVNSFREKCPGIVNAINKVKNKIREILDNKYVNYFINGVSAGYITGNILEMVTGQSIAEHLKDAFNKSETITTPVNPGVLEPNTQSPTVNSTTPKPVTPEPVVPAPLPVSQIELNPGEVFDISGLSEGFVSSTSNSSVSLLTSVGKEAVVDKFVTLPNGEVMVHFKQLNGAGYAWFKESVVKEHLTKIAEAAVKSGKTI